MSSGSSPFERLVTVPVTGSTQDDLRDALTGPEASSWPHLSALRALRQTAGRGRSGHSWITPNDGALLVSVVLRPLVPAERLAWLPLLAGLAVRDALAPFVEELEWRLGTKWPNDVVAEPKDSSTVDVIPGWAGSRKIAGVLSELITQDPSETPAARRPASEEVPASRDQAPVVVLGIGVNIAQEAEDLPVRLLGRREDVPVLMAAADVVVQTSHWEGQPLTIQEALNAGAAVVATDVGGTAVTAVGGAVLVEPTAQALADAVHHLLQDPQALDEARRASRQAAQSLPDRGQLAEQLQRVLRPPSA